MITQWKRMNRDSEWSHEMAKGSLKKSYNCAIQAYVLENLGTGQGFIVFLNVSQFKKNLKFYQQ